MSAVDGGEWHNDIEGGGEEVVDIEGDDVDSVDRSVVGVESVSVYRVKMFLSCRGSGDLQELYISSCDVWMYVCMYMKS